MSYCRFGWDGSDVYVIDTGTELWCCGCKMNFSCQKQEEMINHLAWHRRNGDFVPAYAVEGLWHDIEGAKAPVEREPMVMEARQRLAEIQANMPDFTTAEFRAYIAKIRQSLGRCGECGREKQAP